MSDTTITITGIPTTTDRQAMAAAMAQLATELADEVIAGQHATEADRPSEEDLEWAAAIAAKILLSAEGGELSAAMVVNLLADSSPM
jgi:hypothetical protein